jgi:hypothetical protein
MSQLNKTQLEQENQTNFPNNNTGFITPTKLREFNTDMIDSMTTQGEFNSVSQSLSSSIATINNEIDSLVLSGSGILLSEEGTLLGSVTGLNFIGAATASISGSTGNIRISTIAGSNGTSGTSGVGGTSGTSGINGTNGTNGINGTNGVAGTSGSSGSSGTSGTSGSSGSSGTSGTSGTRGTSGTSGTSGINGTPGSGGS